jgi:hypothetical protein
VIAAPTFGVCVTGADAITDLTDRRLQRLFVNLCFPLSPEAWPRQAGGIAFCAGVLSPIAMSRSSLSASRPIQDAAPNVSNAQIAAIPPKTANGK